MTIHQQKVLDALFASLRAQIESVGEEAGTPVRAFLVVHTDNPNFLTAYEGLKTDTGGTAAWLAANGAAGSLQGLTPPLIKIGASIVSLVKP